jgi:2-C-methyl-D-erythritol 4-phosphate cytidylyltransferase/2-C-methyl-D-erythritol 2,4-cyclodiphosphate synthase
MMTTNKTGAVIVAAGRGERMDGVDKIFVPLAGKPLLAWTVEAFENCVAIDCIVIVLGEHNIEQGKRLAAEYNWKKVADICVGGKERQQSVAKGLKLLKDCRWVVIHDGARPLITPELIEKGLKAAEETGAAAAAVPVTDTIKLSSDDGFIIDTPPRERLWAVQTPQVFRFDIIEEAHRNTDKTATDDAALVEKLGCRIKLYPGSYNNIKITTPIDLSLAEILVKGGNNKMRVGIGYDVHRLAPDLKLVLGGVEIPSRQGLIGWSDADVLTHAVMDALLGAAAMGDIGKHFPPGDPKFKGISSLILLDRVVNMLKEKGWKVGNVDVVIVAEQPKLMEHTDNIRKKLADAMKVSIDAVSVKASTSEQLGFAGREEGMVAWAVATIKEENE